MFRPKKCQVSYCKLERVNNISYLKKCNSIIPLHMEVFHCKIKRVITTTKVTTVLVIIKLTKFAVRVRFRCGSGKLNCVVISPCFLRYLRTLYIAWSLVRHRVTRRLDELQTMHNVLKNRKQKKLKRVAVRMRLGCD